MSRRSSWPSQCGIWRMQSVDEVKQSLGMSVRESHHVTLEVVFLLYLEALEVFQYAGTSILDVSLRDVESLLKLRWH